MACANMKPSRTHPATLEEPRHSLPPEQWLWREVIDCAFRDAVELPRLWFGSRSRNHLERHRARLQDEARSWLLSGGHDFVMVCDLAGRCPAEVRDQARRLLAEPETLARYRAARDSLPGRRSAGSKSAAKRASERGAAGKDASAQPRGILSVETSGRTRPKGEL